MSRKKDEPVPAFLVDKLLSHRESRLRLAAFNRQFSIPEAFTRKFDRIAEQIRDSEIFVLERSALEMAADLRIGSASRLRSLLNVVLHKDRNIYLEFNMKEFDASVLKANPFAIDVDHPRKDAVEGDRFGVIVRIKNGEARMTAAFSHKPSPDSISWRRQLSSVLPLPLKRDMTILSTMQPYAFDIVVRAPFTDRSNVTDLKIISLNYEIGKSKKVNDFYKEYGNLFNYIADDEAHKIIGISNKIMGDQYIQETMRQAIEEWGLYAPGIIACIAMLAVDDNFLKTEKRDASRANVSRRKEQRMPLHDGVSVVRVALQDLGIRKIYEGRARVGDPSLSRRSPGRHPVRGHLFASRSGKVVFRRPHFRGDRDRLVARSIYSRDPD